MRNGLVGAWRRALAGPGGVRLVPSSHQRGTLLFHFVPHSGIWTRPRLPFMLLRGLGVGHSINDTPTTTVAQPTARALMSQKLLLVSLLALACCWPSCSAEDEPTAGPALGMVLVWTERRGPGSICARYATLDPRSVDPLHASMRVSLSCQVNAINRMKPPATLAFSVTL